MIVNSLVLKKNYTAEIETFRAVMHNNGFHFTHTHDANIVCILVIAHK